MKLILQLALFALLSQGGPGAPATSVANPAAIEGRVITLGTGEPIASAGVELIPAGGGQLRTYTAATTDDGKFVLANLPAGTYRLAAAHVGFVRSEYGQRGPNGTGSTITLTGGQRVADIQVRLTETAAISGRIVDRNGDPFPNVQVQALRYVYENGHRVLSSVKAMVADDVGEYRLYWLQPGEYIVMAKPLRGALEDMLMMPIGDGMGFRPIQSVTGAPIVAPDDAASVPFFFPGTLSPESATALRVKPGDDLRSINFAILPVSARRVSGVIANIPANMPVPLEEGGSTFSFVRIGLTPRNPSPFDNESSPAGPGTSVDRKTGAFEIPGVIPGSYFLNASLSVSGNNAIYLHAHFPIEVANDDLKNISVSLEPDFNLSVHVAVEGQSANDPALNLAGLRIRIGSNSMAQPVQNQPGNFTFSRLRSVDDTVSVAQLPEGSYVKSIRLGQTNVLTDGLRIDRAPDSPVEIVLGLNGGVLTGTVIGDASKPVDNANVVLVPETANRQRPDLYRKVVSDAAGHFRITGIAPGDYTAFAWDDVANGAWQNPEFLKPHEARGKAVHIEGGTVVDSTVSVIAN